MFKNRKMSALATSLVVILAVVAVFALRFLPLLGLVPEPQRQLAERGVTNNAMWEPVIRLIDGVAMVLVPSGCFQMGSTDEQLQSALETCDSYYGVFGCKEDFSNEQPVHKVCITQPYWIEQTAVTNWRYGLELSNMDKIPGFWAPNYPRGIITWEQAAVFCRERGARLPTEAEWEFAARGPDAVIYPFGDNYDIEKVTLQKISPAPVGRIAEGASWVGALDMSGGISEWVADWYGPYLAEPQTNPSGPEQGDMRISRGGNWFAHAAFFVRTTYREVLDPEHATSTVGFRCVREFAP